MKTWFLSLLLITAACVEPAAPDKPDDELFQLGAGGKADDGLSSADKQRLIVAFDEAIASAEQTAQLLEEEIAALEAQHAQKQREADSIVAQIAARESELRDSFNANTLLCLLFPNPATCVLANYLLNDSTLKSYRQKLELAQAEQRRIRAAIAEYGIKRDDLRARVTEIRTGKQQLLTMLEDNTLPPAPPELESDPAAAEAYGRAIVMGDLHAAVRAEIDQLVALRNAAVELANTLDQSVATLRALEHSVEQLVIKQRQRFMEMLFALTSGDPAAKAQKWLDAALAQRTTQLLNSIGWPLGEFARYLASSRGEGDLQRLTKAILEKLLADAQPRIFDAQTAVSIHDHTEATSSLQVSDDRPFTVIEVSVDIEHSYVGDLEVWIERGAHRVTLSDRSGGSGDDLVATYMLPELDGLEVRGTWTLHVADRVAGDVGQLRSWQLIVR